MSELLKPCRFCGDKPKAAPDSPDDYVLCFNVCCPIYEVTISIDAWNARPSPWIAVEDGLPEKQEKDFRYSKNVWCVDMITQFTARDMYDYNNNCWSNHSRKYTHWQYIELPALSGGEE